MKMTNPHKMPFIGQFAKSVASLCREDEKGLLYHMDYSADYYKLLPALDIAAKSGCSTFVTRTVDGDPIMARNFDYRHFRNNVETTEDEITGLQVVVHCSNPKAKYRSLGIADAYWLGLRNGTFYEGVLDDGKTDISMALFLPFLCMDGMNEKGLAVSIMYLPTENRWDETEYVEAESLTAAQKRTAVILNEPGAEPSALEPRTQSGSYAINTADRRAWKAYKNFALHQKEKGKKTVLHPVLMRMMLDSCETVEEAITLALSVNVKSVVRDADYHILVTDANGRTVILEWIDRKLVCCDTCHGANFYVGREDRFGYGYDRDELMKASMSKYSQGMPENVAMHTLAVASQNTRDGSGQSFTQWSAVYNLKRQTLKLCVHMNYDKVFQYELL